MSLTREIIELEWKDLRSEVKYLNPELAEIIDQIDPDKRYTFFKVKYLFGDLIVNQGKTYLPNPNRQGALNTLDEAGFPAKIANKLSYSHIPCFLILQNTSEVFSAGYSRIVPMSLFYPGDLLGLFETIDALFDITVYRRWNVSAGARSIFLLPRINENTGVKRLSVEYSLPLSMSWNHISEHWQLFSTIAKHPQFPQPWCNEILFFSDSWFNLKNKHKNWTEFYNYLFKISWQQAHFALDRVQSSLRWEYFMETIAARNLKPTTWLADQVKHVMSIADGRLPGFRPAVHDSLTGPIEGIKKAVIEVYGLKNYLPTIMHPGSLSDQMTLPVYYSLYYPTLLEGTPNNKNNSTLMIELRNMKMLLDTYIQRNYSNQQCALSRQIIHNTKFDYYHVELDKYGEIQPSSLIAKEDPDFSLDSKRYPEREFCSTASFWRGCMKIGRK